MDSIRAAAPAESIPVDVNDLLGRCLGRIDLAERIIKKFQTTLEADLQQLEAAVRASDVGEIAHIAHRIKGASLAVSANSLTEYAKRIELSANALELEVIPDQLECLKRVCTQFLEMVPSLSMTSPVPN